MSQVLKFPVALSAIEVVIKKVLLSPHTHHTQNSFCHKNMFKNDEKSEIFNKFRIFRVHAREITKRWVNMCTMPHLNIGDFRDVLVILSRKTLLTKLVQFCHYSAWYDTAL